MTNYLLYKEDITHQKGLVTYSMPMLGWNGPQEILDPHLLPNRNVCSCCGKLAGKLTMIDDETAVCDHCLDNRYILCDQCGEYYPDNIEMHEVNGMTVCEYCYEELDENDEK